MSWNKGFVFLDTLIGMFIVMIMLSLVVMMTSLKHGFHYDFRQEEMKEIWQDPQGSSLYFPEITPELPVLPPVEDTPLLN